VPRDQVFISYSHNDIKWREDLEKRLKPFLRAGSIKSWSDKQISPGSKWFGEIKSAMADTKVAVLLVSPDFLASDFIHEHELGPFLKETEQGGVKILWVPVRASGYEQTPLADYQAVLDPSKPLAGMTKAKRDQAWVKICEEIAKAVNLSQELPSADSLKDAPPPPTGLPTPPPVFVKLQAEWDEIKRSLVSDLVDSTDRGVSRRCVALWGMGGVGKTVLAAALAREEDVIGAFLDGVFWIHLGAKPNLPVRLYDIARLLGEEGPVFADIEQARLRLGILLRGKRCLFILDDALEMSHVGSILGIGERCALLLTTRDAEIWRGLNAIAHEVHPWSQHRSLQLLASWSKCDPNDLPSEARLVAEECAGLPLALAMVGARARGNSTNWSHLLASLQHSALTQIVQRLPDYPMRTLWGAMDTCVQALELDGMLERYLDLAVFEDTARIPLQALTTFWDYQSRVDVEQLVSRFEDLCLAQRTNDFVTLHDLLHDYLRERTRDTAQVLHATLVASYREIATEGWSKLASDGYFPRALPFHLEHAGLDEELHSLLAPDPQSQQLPWYEVAHETGMVFQYHQDVERGFRRAAMSFNRKHDSESLQRIIYYSLIRSSLHTFAELLPPELPALLVDAGVWSPSIALQYIQNRLSPDDTMEGLLALAASTSPPADREAFLTLAAAQIGKGISNPATVLPEVCRLASDPLRETIADQLLSITDPYQWALAGAALLPLVSPSKATALANHVLGLYRSLSEEYMASRADTWWRETLLSDAAWSSTFTRQDAVVAVEIRILAALSQYLEPAVREAVSQEALSKADGMSQPESRFFARTLLLSHLSTEKTRALLDRCLADISLHFAPRLVSKFIAAAVEVGLDQRTAESVANRITDTYSRLISFAAIRRFLRQELAEGQVDEVFAYLSAPENEIKAGLVVAVIPVLSSRYGDRVFPIVTSFDKFDDLLAVIRVTETSRLFSISQRQALRKLAQEQVISKAGTGSWSHFCSLFDAFGGEARIQWLGNDRMYYRSMVHGHAQNQLALCKYLPAPERTDVIRQIYDRCGGASDGFEWLTFRIALLGLFSVFERGLRRAALLSEFDRFRMTNEHGFVPESRARCLRSEKFTWREPLS
jgi:hypothetical protein